MTEEERRQYQESLEYYAAASGCTVTGISLEGTVLKVSMRMAPYPEFIEVDLGLAQTDVRRTRHGEVLQLTSLGFVAMMSEDGLPADTEEFPIDDVSEDDRGLVQVGAKFTEKSGFRTYADGGKNRFTFLEFDGGMKLAE